jgi:hypothetical protein
MLGGEIYYRAIGRPWGPAVDFIHIVFHLSAPGRLLSSIRGPPARAIPKFKFVWPTHRHGQVPLTVGPPPSVCPTVCLPRRGRWSAPAPGPVRSCYHESAFRFGPGKKKHQGPVLPSGRNETNRNTKECGAGLSLRLADTVWDIRGVTINTRFGFRSQQSAISNQRIKAWWLPLHNISPNVGSCIFRD